eukprot:1148145-Pelagomonas_calceolata.AAC.1
MSEGVGGPPSPHFCFHSGSTSHKLPKFKIWGRNSEVCSDIQPNFDQAGVSPPVTGNKTKSSAKKGSFNKLSKVTSFAEHYIPFWHQWPVQTSLRLKFTTRPPSGPSMDEVAAEATARRLGEAVRAGGRGRGSGTCENAAEGASSRARGKGRGR